jgi:AraC-like DNA-binding protein/quercetin dioxygenase-like cupin family protein
MADLWTMDRSTDPRDYQALSVAVAAMRKSFAAGETIAPHHHARDQLIYAVSGTMRVRAADRAWIVPPDRALYVPAGVEHQLAMRGPVEMRTLYIAPATHEGLPRQPTVLAVSAMLHALVLALLDEPIAYDTSGRGGHIAALIADEIARSRRLALDIPMPRDKRLVRLCERLLADPSCEDTLDRLADDVGASARTLARLFQRDCGMTFTGWRQRVRFHSALEALAHGEPVARVARDNGYASPSAFSAAFRRSLGMSPSRVLETASGRSREIG